MKLETAIWVCLVVLAFGACCMIVGYRMGKLHADRYYAEHPVTLIQPERAHAPANNENCLVTEGENLDGPTPPITWCADSAVNVIPPIKLRAPEPVASLEPK